jgi:L-threonylcarbamoyladenylate synthase
LIETEIVKISTKKPKDSIIQKAAEILRSGGLVAFPTETVYGLGADALNSKAVEKVFVAKGRPSDNPMIVHIAEFNQLKMLTTKISKIGKILADAFWPGPMTLVLKSSNKVPKVVNGGLETVAVRMPNHPVTLTLIKKLDRPIVGPSANKSGRPSPTTAQHVYEDLQGKVDLILDTGRTKIGIESTVIDVTSSPPVILRFGGLTKERIEKLIGRVGTTENRLVLKRSPGTRYRHYAPNAKVILFEKGDKVTFDRLYKNYKKQGKEVGFIMISNLAKKIRTKLGKIIPGNINNYSQQLFNLLRELDNSGADIILVESVEENGLGKAIMDRLRKAASS